MSGYEWVAETGRVAEQQMPGLQVQESTDPRGASVREVYYNGHRLGRVQGYRMDFGGVRYPRWMSEPAGGAARLSHQSLWKAVLRLRRLEGLD